MRVFVMHLLLLQSFACTRTLDCSFIFSFFFCSFIVIANDIYAFAITLFSMKNLSQSLFDVVLKLCEIAFGERTSFAVGSVLWGEQNRCGRKERGSTFGVN